MGRSSLSTPSVDMTNWQTYRNEEYGFEFKYPPDFNGEILGNMSQNIHLRKEIEGGNWLIDMNFIGDKEILWDASIPTPNTIFNGSEAIKYGPANCEADFDAKHTSIICRGFTI